MSSAATHSSPQVGVGPPDYRQARPLPSQILDRVNISIEAQLYSQALHLLTQCLTAATYGPRAAAIPSQDVLVYMATVCVHPTMTTRTLSSEKHAASDQALDYLQLLISLIDPQSSGLRGAFLFTSLRQSRSGRVQSRAFAQDQTRDYNAIKSVYANEQSIWKNAGDIWHVIGWAFNCSALHRRRWARWKLFLTLLIELLERDVNHFVYNAPSKDETEGSDSRAENTLLYHYLTNGTDARQQKRRIMRAILADGTSKALAEFPEVWNGETMLPKPKSQPSRHEMKLDLDNDKYADYDESSEDDLEGSPDNISTAASTNHPQELPMTDMLDTESVILRQKLLALLLLFCQASPQTFLIQDELLDLYAESLRGLPIRRFQQLLASPTPFFDMDVKSALNQILLRTLIDSSAPIYTKRTLTQADFEAFFAPFPANLHSVLDNAKVSLLTEDLLRMLWKADALQHSVGLRTAVAKGIEQRNEKARFDARKRDPNKSREERDSRQELRLSAERMLCVLDMIQ